MWDFWFVSLCCEIVGLYLCDAKLLVCFFVVWDGRCFLIVWHRSSIKHVSHGPVCIDTFIYSHTEVGTEDQTGCLTITVYLLHGNNSLALGQTSVRVTTRKSIYFSVYYLIKMGLWVFCFGHRYLNNWTTRAILACGECNSPLKFEECYSKFAAKMSVRWNRWSVYLPY